MQMMPTQIAFSRRPSPAVASTAVKGRWRWSALWPMSGASREIAALDGLRGVAVLLVMVVHSCYELRSQTGNPAIADFLTGTVAIWTLGGSGVHLFFVLSGFLLFLRYARAMVGEQSFPSTRSFYYRRALRIMPAYWASLILLAVIFSHQYLTRQQVPNLVLHALVLHNWTQETMTSMNVYWTLAVECQYYLLLPALGWLLCRLYSARRFGTITALSVSALFASTAVNLIRILIRRRFPALDPHARLLDVFDYLTVFGLGMMAAFVYVQAGRASPQRARSIRSGCRMAGLVGVFVLAGHVLLAGLKVNMARLDYFGFNAMMGFSYAGIVLAALLGWKTWSAFLSSAALRFAGGISYSLYLWHYPLYERVVVPVAVRYAVGWKQAACVVLGTCLIIVPLSLASYLLFERPFFQFRRARD